MTLFGQWCHTRSLLACLHTEASRESVICDLRLFGAAVQPCQELIIMNDLLFPDCKSKDN